MENEIVILALGSTALFALMVIVPFLLHHQRKMAEMMTKKSNSVGADLEQRIERLTDAVYQLAARIDEKELLARQDSDLQERL